MVRLIDAEKQAVMLRKAAAQLLVNAQSTYDTGWAKGLIDAADTLKNATIIDAVPVVRCKDCADCYAAKYRSGKVYFYQCLKFDVEVEQDGFCSYGERRNDAAGQ